MQRSARSSKAVRVGDSLHQHLHMYALAASAAGVSMMALAQPGAAEIIYTPANVTIGSNQEYGLDLTGSGTIDFTFKAFGKYFPPVTYIWSFFVKHPPKGNEVAAHLAFGGYQHGGVHHFAYALNSGLPISDQVRHFSGGRASMTWFCACDAGSFFAGSWRSLPGGSGLSNRYLGLKFMIDGQVHYGWARLSAGLGSAVLTGYAYETIPNQGLNAGQEQEGQKSGQRDPATLTQAPQQPASLGALANGSRGLSRWRRRQAVPGDN